MEALPFKTPAAALHTEVVGSGAAYQDVVARVEGQSVARILEEDCRDGEAPCGRGARPSACERGARSRGVRAPHERLTAVRASFLCAAQPTEAMSSSCNCADGWRCGAIGLGTAGHSSRSPIAALTRRIRRTCGWLSTSEKRSAIGSTPTRAEHRVPHRRSDSRQSALEAPPSRARTSEFASARLARSRSSHPQSSPYPPQR